MHKVYISEDKGVPVIYNTECFKKTNVVKVPKKRVVGTSCLVGWLVLWLVFFFGKASAPP